VDFEKAFDSLARDVNWQVMKIYTVPKKIINMMKCLYEGFKCRVFHYGQPIDSSEVTTRVGHGCVLSSTLFLVAHDNVMNKILILLMTFVYFHKGGVTNKLSWRNYKRKQQRQDLKYMNLQLRKWESTLAQTWS